MRLPRAWDASTGAGAVVAVLDTGVLGAHQSSPAPCSRHGPDRGRTRIPRTSTGTARSSRAWSRAHANNAYGAAGAAYGAKILPVKVLDDAGRAPTRRSPQGSRGPRRTAPTSSTSRSGDPDLGPILLTAIQNAVAAGVVVVAAAGNEGTDEPMYPAAYAPQVDGLLAVSATDDYGSLDELQQLGRLGQPRGAGRLGHRAGDDGRRYAYGNGTSFAAPFVSGAAALVLAHATDA